MVNLIRFLFHLQVKQESLGISTKMFLKVDVEGGKLYFKKSKDGPEDKYFVHNKSKKSHPAVARFLCIFRQASNGAPTVRQTSWTGNIFTIIRWVAM